jgi:hypothetical protein
VVRGDGGAAVDVRVAPVREMQEPPLKVPDKLLAWKEANPERVKESAKERLKKWRKANPEKYKAQRDAGKEKKSEYYYQTRDRHRCRMLQYNYGITLEQYNLLLEEQEGRCKICRTDKCTTGKALAVDHCHETGKVRGLLCKNCNIGLGMFKHDRERLRMAAEYMGAFE